MLDYRWKIASIDTYGWGGGKVVIRAENDGDRYSDTCLEEVTFEKLNNGSWKLTGKQQLWRCPFEKGAYNIDDIYPEYITTTATGFFAKLFGREAKKVSKSGWIRLKGYEKFERVYINVPIEVRFPNGERKCL